VVKGIFSVFLSLAILILQGCHQGRQDTKELHFLMWKPHQPKPLEKAIRLFEERHPGVHVDRHIGSENASEYYRELTTKLRNQDPDLDVFFLDVVWPAEFVARGYLENLSDRFPPSEQADFFPGPISADTVDGKIFAVPFNIDVGLLFYRKDLLEKYGFKPPKTWAEMIRQMDTILKGESKQDPDLIGYAGQFEKYEGLVCNVLEFTAGNGASFLDSDGNPAVTDPRVIEAVRFIRDDLIHDKAHPRRATGYLLTAKEQESREIFARGDAIFLRNWPETWGILTDPKRSKVYDRVGMAVLPAFEGGHSVGTLGGWQLGIASFSHHKDLAWQFIQFMTSHDIQRMLAIEQAQTMARLTIYDDPVLLKAVPHFGKPGPWGAPLRDVAMVATPRPGLVRYNAVSERLQQCLHEAIRDPDSDIKALMSDCADQIRRETERLGAPNRSSQGS
jgi:trehalose/maltose transport system substrate-binding protein